MITINNRQRTVPGCVQQVRTDLEKCLQFLRYQDFDIGVLLTSDATIRRYNKTYRGKDKATDILSFPAHPDALPGKRIRASSQDEKNLGDLILSVPYIVRAAQELNVSFEDRLRVLLVHGLCHLLGYDHERDDDYKKMRRKELALLRALNKTE